MADNTTDDKRSIPMLKTYTVFNVSQLESVPDWFVHSPGVAWHPVQEAEQTLNNTGAVICHGGDQAFYRPGGDFIQLPALTSFTKHEDYYATAMHELSHWTGHKSRLNRVLTGRRDIEAYAYEELIAEIGSALLCAHCGLSAHLEHASHVSIWLDALRRDKRLIFVAAGAAQKAADFVLGSATEAERVAAIDLL